MSATTAICLEIGSTRVFASALDWPGWCRSGKTEEQAIETLADYAERYAPVATRAGLSLPRTAGSRFDVTERLDGDGSTDFGAPGKVAAAEQAPVDARQAARLAILVEAAWDTLADVAAHAPTELRKGPRGGGRDRDAVVAHVADAEISYSRKLGIRGIKDSAQVRKAIIEVLGLPNDGTAPSPKGWPTRYMARRIAWHVLDHAWEIEDKS